ncbi:serine hydrolase domain-containing protein [Nocardiopsis mangrovi]|uniref:Serine hydrolase domain-containing protein n=1 Tax=Nocardiopsis mangrovi TaxID=1179818 RepID=A0ABV9DUT3_9ACTN
MRSPLRPPLRLVVSAGLSTALSLGLIAGAAPAIAGTGASAADTGAADPSPVSEEGVRAFLDERVPALLEEFDTPGAAVSVSQGSTALFQQGYGVTDLESEEPVSAEGTSFPVASVSKSFTAVAMLQLVDQGEIDLGTDVNEYLPEGIRIPDTYPGRPITPHHLLTHTSGFEEAVGGMMPVEGEPVSPLRDYIGEHVPERVEPPGRFVSYSNYGTAMAGLIVEEVSGQDFMDYTQEHVFAPLGMERSGFATTDAAGERFDVPAVHRYPGRNEVQPPEALNVIPAGGAYATAADMTRFMGALLGGGELDGTRVLSPESTELMLGHRAGNHDLLAGSGYGTWERHLDPVRVVGHTGDLGGAHSEYALVPGADLGVFVTVNSDGSGTDILNDLRTTIVTEFLEEFAGTAAQGSGTAADGAGNGDPDAFAGVYLTTRSAENDPSALKTAMDQMTVTAAADGTLRTSSPILSGATWTPIGDGVFRNETGDRLAFMEEDGEIIGLTMDALASQGYKRVDAYADPQLHVMVALGALAVIATMVAWPVTALVRTVRGADAAPYRGAARAGRIGAALTGLICVGFTGFLVYALSNGGMLETLLFTSSPALTVPLAIAGVLTAGLLVAAAASWSRGWWTLSGRLHYTLVVLAAAVFIGIGGWYNLVWLP